MYEKFFGFKEKPFSIIPDASYFYQSRQHRLALAQLEYGLLNRVGFIVISGEIGTGKTTLIRTLMTKLDKDINVASIFNTTVTPSEFLDLVLREFGLDPGKGNRSAKLNRLREYLTKRHEQGIRSLLIIDEAQNLSIETLEEIRLLSNMEKDKEYLLHIVMVGQTEIREKLLHPALNQLAQRIAVHYNLAPLNEEETENYIMYRLSVASASDKPGVIFAKEALRAIYRYTNGIPRLINVLCDLCLVYAYADELRGINLQVVEEVVKNQEASGFSSLFTVCEDSTASTQDEALETAKHESPVLASLQNDTLRVLEAKVADLQSGLIAINRTVQDFLLEENGRTSRKQEKREKALQKTIDVQKVEIERLKAERKELLKRIYELSNRLSRQNDRGIDSETGAETQPTDRHAATTATLPGMEQAEPLNMKRQRVPAGKGTSRYWLWAGAAATIAICSAALMYEPLRQQVLHAVLVSLPF